MLLTTYKQLYNILLFTKTIPNIPLYSSFYYLSAYALL